MASTKLTVFTLNCYAIAYVPFMKSPYRKKRIEALADHLESSGYDFVCLQEVWTESDQLKIKTRCKKSLPYSMTFFGGIIGTGTLILSRWPIEDSNYLRFSMNGFLHHLQYGDALTGAGIGLAKIRVEDGLLVNLYVSHYHAEYNRAKDPYLADRVVQALEAGNFIQMTSQGSDLILYCGDFNTEPGDLPHQILTKMFKLNDPHSSTPLKTHYRKENSFTEAYVTRPITIDYIMNKPVSSGSGTVEVIKLEFPLKERIDKANTSFSDHEALLTEIQFTKNDEEKPVSDSSELPSNVLKEVLDVLGAELDTSWFWQLTHASGLFLVTVLAFRGMLYCDGMCGNVSGFIFGVSFLFLSGLILFYQKRRYTIRQIQSQIKLKQVQAKK